MEKIALKRKKEININTRTKYWTFFSERLKSYLHDQYKLIKKLFSS